MRRMQSAKGTRVTESKSRSRSGKMSPAGNGSSLVMQFDDNRLLTELFGQGNSNLARIEEGLRVLTTTRGNRLVVTGSQEGREAAKHVLDDLYARLKSEPMAADAS